MFAGGFRRMRYGLVFSTVVAIFGVVLVSGSLLVVPYTVMEPVRVDRSKTWMEETFTLQPNKNRTHVFDSIARNLSIFQMDLQPSLPLVFKIVDDNRGELVFEWLRGGTIFWTPLSIGGNWRFLCRSRERVD
jgi:hypothetical protein